MINGTWIDGLCGQEFSAVYIVLFIQQDVSYGL